MDQLLDNALTFSPADRPVVVTAAPGRRWVRFSVADFGIGMTADEVARCFEQFWQNHSGAPFRRGGTGIGLSSVRSLVEGMGGRVTVRSAPGKGSTFTVLLPRGGRGGARPVATAPLPGVGEPSPAGAGTASWPGTPLWLGAVPTAAAVYLTVLVTGVVVGPGLAFRPGLMAGANAVLVGIYLAIGWFLLCTQLRNRRVIRGWSVSGLSLTGVFPTCALMHAVWIVYDMSGAYHADGHGLAIDLLSIPAGLYFLWVVRGLYRDSLRDWNRVAYEDAPAGG